MCKGWYPEVVTEQDCLVALGGDYDSFETFIDGETGLLYHGGDVEALCNKIEAFLNIPNNEREEMGIKGRKYIKTNFSRDIVINAYLKQINELR